MKRSIIILVLITLFIHASFAQQGKVQKNDPVGKWKFEAPSAPAEYTSGTIEVVFAEKKHSAAMMFTGSDYKIPGENVKVGNDSVLFSVYVDGQMVKVSLKFSEPLKMSGKAVYSEGEVPLLLTKDSKTK
jgi:hypothetical protein